MMYNASKSTWLNPNIEYLFDNQIIEYDMQDAGFSIIKQYNLLPKETIQRLSSLDKGRERHIAIGKLQGENKEFADALKEKFAEMRSFFIMANELTDDDIISVKKDAIYTIGNVHKRIFGKVEFREKNTYTSYIRFSNINNLEIYYADGIMDIKGISDESINKHRLFMYEFIYDIITMIESHDAGLKRKLMGFIDQYKSLEIDQEYYLEFNNKSRELNPMFNYQNILIPLVQIVLREGAT